MTLLAIPALVLLVLIVAVYVALLCVMAYAWLMVRRCRAQERRGFVLAGQRYSKIGDVVIIEDVAHLFGTRSVTDTAYVTRYRSDDTAV